MHDDEERKTNKILYIYIYMRSDLPKANLQVWRKILNLTKITIFASLPENKALQTKIINN